jgi:hypothetical protein
MGIKKCRILRKFEKFKQNAPKKSSVRITDFFFTQGKVSLYIEICIFST